MTARSISRSIARPISNSVVGGVVTVKLPALITSLFGNGEQGVMYIPEPTVLGQQVLYQDSEGTEPVMSDGDPVGLMLDLSGNDNHATQSISAARPVYRTDGVRHWLEGTGTDQHMLVESRPGLAGASSTLLSMAAVETVSANRQTHWIEQYQTAGDDRSHVLVHGGANPGNGIRAGTSSTGRNNAFQNSSVLTLSDNTPAVIGLWWQSSQQYGVLKGRDHDLTSTSYSQLHAAVNQPISIGSSLYSTGRSFDGRIYGVCLVKDEVSFDGRLPLAEILANLAGVTL